MLALKVSKTFHKTTCLLALKVSKNFAYYACLLALKVYKTFHKPPACLLYFALKVYKLFINVRAWALTACFKSL